jgi:hypothetical protein
LTLSEVEIYRRSRLHHAIEHEKANLSHLSKNNHTISAPHVQ